MNYIILSIFLSFKLVFIAYLSMNMTKNKIKIILHKHKLLRSSIKIIIKTHSTKHFYLLNIKQKNSGVKLTSESTKKKKMFE